MTHAITLDEAYAACRAIAKREAKNFYYAFVLCPPARKNAICAIYAFMRQADDLADDESLSRDERRRQLDAWLAEWRNACQRQFDKLIRFFLQCAMRRSASRFRLACWTNWWPAPQWTSKPTGGDAPDTYATFADLYRYCYLVASVVGLVCIRIFGYTDPPQKSWLRRPGIAFQLTNILRDVAEDAARNRVYLPLEDLAATSCISRLAAAPRSRRAAGGKRTRIAQRHCRPRGALLPIGEGAAAADRPRKPARALGAGVDLSRACSSASGARITMCSRAGPACL